MAKGRFGQDEGQAIDLSRLQIGALKVDLEDVLHRGDTGIVVLSYEVRSHGVEPVKLSKDQETLARVHKGRVIGVVPLPEGFDRQKLWDAIQREVDAKQGKQQFDWDDGAPNPLDVPPSPEA